MEGQLTVVVPTRNEAENVGRLVKELSRHVPEGTRLIFVDDSTNEDTLWEMEGAKATFPELSITIVHRPPNERITGLAGAVTLGISLAQSELVVVMDGDLQHPPSTIPTMLRCISTPLKHDRQLDLVIASRYCPGGSADGLSGPIRHLVSRLSTWVARGLFPVALQGVTDPMTGFFMCRRESIDTERLRARGFKILLEILVQHPKLSRRQVPLQFGERTDGDSKGTSDQGLMYLQQLIRLRFTSKRRRTNRYAVMTP